MGLYQRRVTQTFYVVADNESDAAKMFNTRCSEVTAGAKRIAFIGDGGELIHEWTTRPAPDVQGEGNDEV